MTYKFPIPAELVGRPIIYCRHCHAKLAEQRLENGRLGLFTTDGNRHQCPVLIERGVKRCDYCCGQIVHGAQFRAFDLDGRDHGPTCVATLHKETAPKALNGRRKQR